MNIPKCKECESFVERFSETGMNPKNKTYWCRKATKLDVGLFESNILAKETRTSPKWCPKRNKKIYDI